jgi:hypothetical protein
LVPPGVMLAITLVASAGNFIVLCKKVQ